MLEYDLGKMRGADGSSLRYEVETKASELAIRISHMIESTSIYRELAKKLPSDRVLLYFQYVVKKEIYPFVRQACVTQWYKRNGKSIAINEGVILIPKSGIFKELKKCWNFKNVPIKFKGRMSFDSIGSASLRKWIRCFIRKGLNKLVGISNRPKENCSFPIQEKEGGFIACHYAEGLDPSRRNDLNWYPESGINPKKVLIYFDSFDSKTGEQIKKETIQQVEKQGFRWVALKKGIIENQGSNYWQAPRLPKNLLIKKSMAQNKIDKWLIEVANQLLEEVYYWHTFYKNFNIKINYIPEEGIAKSIAQAIAFDIDNEAGGFLAGKQRSEIFLPMSFYLGHHPKHIFFIWNKRVLPYFNPNYEQVETCIITGYPNNIFGRSNIFDLNLSQKLRSNGGNFIIALFDNVHGPDIHYSTEQMTEFYQRILKWVLDDPTIGLIIKSKKPLVINNLPSIHSLLNKVLETDRCVKIEDEQGRFPSDASCGADIAIGCGISSALIEAVIAGCRGIHYDMTHLRNHEFYQWGYERIIFDNLERMMVFLKRYKENPTNEPTLGDWSAYIEKLDPFRDGCAGERAGTYMRWLLESFDRGESRDEAMQYANGLYAEEWGEDKVIDMRH